ncbi:MAG: hypothetical protein ACP5N2_02955 [Candidatus Nanoarchaeia archaeon]
MNSKFNKRTGEGILSDSFWGPVISEMRGPEIDNINDALNQGTEGISVQFMPDIIGLKYFPNNEFFKLVKIYEDGELLEKVISESMKGDEIVRVVDLEKVILYKYGESLVYFLSKSENDLQEILGKHYDKIQNSMKASSMREAITNLDSKYNHNLRIEHSVDQGLLELLTRFQSEALSFQDNIFKVDFTKVVELTKKVLDLPVPKEVFRYNSSGFEVDIGKIYEILNVGLPHYVILGGYPNGIALVRKNFIDDPAVIFKPNGKSSFHFYKIRE